MCDHCDENCDHNCELCNEDNGETMQERIERLREWEDMCLDKYGYYVHVVPSEDTGSPTGYNMHTHGLNECSTPHEDFQIVLPIDPKIGHALIAGAVDRIKDEGIVFKPGQRYDKIMRSYDVAFGYATECDRLVLRMILPDADGRLMPEDYSEKDKDNPFFLQWKGTFEV